MKSRLLVAAVGIPLLLAVFLLLPKLVTAFLLAAICGIAAYELLRAAGGFRNARLYAAAILMAVFVCLWSGFGSPLLPLQLAAAVFLLWLLAELLLADTALPFTGLCVCVFAGLVLPLLLSSVTRILLTENGRFFVLLPFVMTMVPDAGAFFAGRRFGAHPLAPHISPKKTVEGAVGGAAAAVLAMLLYALILLLCGFRVRFLYAALYGLVGAAGSIAGDLAFSTVKRQHGIKDFGNLLPGHGGALDRFDSLTVVAPLTELLLLLIPMAVR